MPMTPKFARLLSLSLAFLSPLFALEEDALLDFTYPAKDQRGQPAMLYGGSYAGDQLRVRVVRTLVADFDSDGSAEGAVVVTVSSGGSATQYELCLLKPKGEGVVYVDSQSLGANIQLNSLTFRYSELAVEFVTRDPGEPLSVAPHQLRIASYRMDGDRLEPLVSLK